MDLNNKRILYAVSSMGLGHVQRSLPILKYLLAAGGRLIVVSHGRALDMLKLELSAYPCVEYLAIADYPPIQRGCGLAHYLYFLPDLLKTGLRIREETELLKTLSQQTRIDLVFADGRFGFIDPGIPSFLICHQIRFLLPRWLRVFQPLSDIGQYRLLRKFNRVFVPDFEDSNFSLAGQLSHNWMARKLKAHYIGFLSSIKKTHAPKTIDIVFITGGFIEPERLKIVDWARRHLIHLGQKVVFILGAAGNLGEAVPAANGIETYACVHGEKRNELLNAARVLVGRTGYTTLMDVCELGIHAALTPTAGMTEQEYLAGRIARLNHPLPIDIGADHGLKWVGIDGEALHPSIASWNTEKSVKRLADYLGGFDHA